MKKKLVFWIITAIAIGVVTTLVSIPSEKSERQEIYHARLADPNLYKDGVFSETFTIKEGQRDRKSVV